MTISWHQELTSAVRDAEIKVLGQDDVKNEAHARAAIAVLKAYGDSPAGFVYIEPCTARSTRRPPDIIICHPDVGLLVVECKGLPLKIIEGIEAGSLLIRRKGMIRPENPLRQAEECMFDIEDAAKRIVRQRRVLPLCNFVVCFPKISESAWSSRGFDKTLPNVHLLFKEHVEAPRRLKQRISMLVRETLDLSRKEKPITAEQINIIKQVFGDSSVINERRPPRAWVEERKLGAYVDEMVALDKYLSAEQQELSRLNVEGHPRLIRGVAGSGKTIVLANQVARFISRKVSQPADMFEGPPPSPRVAVVCFNNALVKFIQRKIRNSYRQHTLESLPSDMVTVTHLNGLMMELSDQGVWDYVTIPEVRDPVDRAVIYGKQLQDFASENPEWYEALLYDAIFVDEGQDFVPEEYQLLQELVKKDPRTGERTLVIFYDDAQNLYARPRPNWKQIGIDVQRGDRSRVMKECFRNTREVIELAFNVLLGSQAPPDLRVQTRTYADVNYLKNLGLVEENGDHFRVRFAERTFNKPIIRKFDSRLREKEWVASEVVRLVEGEQVRSEDIVILFHRKEDFEDMPEIISAEIENNSIKGFIRPYGGNSDRKEYIFREGHLTVSTTYGAKGYDSQIVFLIGADLFGPDNKGRASFYVGATRAKMLLYITGLETPGSLVKEAEAINSVL